VKKIISYLDRNEFNTRPTKAEQVSIGGASQSGQFTTSTYSDHMRHFGTPVRREESDEEHLEIIHETLEEYDADGNRINKETINERITNDGPPLTPDDNVDTLSGGNS
jgi:hypothetical protein